MEEDKLPKKDLSAEKLKKLQKEFDLLKKEVLDGRALEKELLETKKELKKVAQKLLSKEVVVELSALSTFLFKCYKESENVAVRTKINEWRSMIEKITSNA